MLNPSEVLYIWFDSLFESDISLAGKVEKWLSTQKGIDKILRKRLFAYTTLASENALRDWQNTPRGMLALVILLDRVTRACYRGTDLGFSNDVKARQLALTAIDKGYDWKLTNIERVFLIFPLLASEKLNHQLIAKQKLEGFLINASDEEKVLCNNLIELAVRNTLVLQRFSRFPHRAARLKMGLTDPEKRFVMQYGWQDWL